MSGKVVAPAVVPHHCNPGWEWVWTDDPSGIAGSIGGHYYGVMPDPWKFPAGTVWECECGRTFVSLGSRYLNSPGDCGWRREPRLARWWRLRKLRT